MKTKNIFSFIGFVFALFIFANNSLAGSFGVSPPWVINKNLKPGSEFIYTINLSTNEPNEEMKVDFNLTGDEEVKNWVNVRNSGDFVMPVGQKIVPLLIDVKIPENAKVGDYKGNISIRLSPNNSPQNTVAVLLGGSIDIDLGVTNRNVTDFKVKGVALNKATEGQVLSANLNLKNSGNTTLSEVQTYLKIKNKKGEVVREMDAKKLNRVIYPETNETARIEFDVIDFEPGRHSVEVEVLNGSKSIYKNELPFYLGALDVNGRVKTSVLVTDKLKKSAHENSDSNNKMNMEKGRSNDVELMKANDMLNSKVVKTSVRVTDPTNTRLIAVLIILVAIVSVFVVKIYLKISGKNKK